MDSVGSSLTTIENAFHRSWICLCEWVSGSLILAFRSLILRMYLSHLYGEITKITAFTYKNWIMTKRNFFTFFEIIFWPVVGFMSVGLLAEFTQLQPEMRAFILLVLMTMAA